MRLFTVKGVAATGVEEIAAAAGISTRTFWRYFTTKEACVMPLLTAGVEAIADALREWRTESGVAGLLADIGRRSEGRAADTSTSLALAAMARTEPGLHAVWLRAHDVAERSFAAALAQREGLPAESLQPRVRAAMLNGALRAAVEHYVETHSLDDADGMVEAVREALFLATRGFEDQSGKGAAETSSEKR